MVCRIQRSNCSLWCDLVFFYVWQCCRRLRILRVRWGTFALWTPCENFWPWWMSTHFGLVIAHVAGSQRIGRLYRMVTRKRISAECLFFLLSLCTMCCCTNACCGIWCILFNSLTGFVEHHRKSIVLVETVDVLSPTAGMNNQVVEVAHIARVSYFIVFSDLREAAIGYGFIANSAKLQGSCKYWHRWNPTQEDISPNATNYIRCSLLHWNWRFLAELVMCTT